jgi:hypothetical protein
VHAPICAIRAAHAQLHPARSVILDRVGFRFAGCRRKRNRVALAHLQVAADVGFELL